jgi:hypothetical protein
VRRGAGEGHHRRHPRKEHNLYAQLVRTRASEQTRAEMHRIVSDELIPGLHDEPGFVGALNLVDPDTGDAMMIVVWQLAEQAQRPLGDNGTTVLARLLQVAGSAHGDHEPTAVWEVTVRI